MSENSYTVGLLITACVLLVFAIVITVVDISAYKGREAGPPAQPPAAVEPAEGAAPATGTEPAEETPSAAPAAEAEAGT